MVATALVGAETIAGASMAAFFQRSDISRQARVAGCIALVLAMFTSCGQSNAEGTAAEAPVFGSTLASGVAAEFEMRHWSHDASSLWEATISPLRDYSDEAIVIDPTLSPPGGIMFVAFDVDLARVEGADESVLTVFDWEVWGGASKQAYAASTDRSLASCVFARWDSEAMLKVGDQTSGTMCMPIAAEDLGHPDTVISLRFGNDERVSWAAQ